MSDSRIPFSVAAGVPIVGQPCTIITWFPTLSITCNCEAKQPVLLVGIGNLSVCVNCGRGFQLIGVRQNATGEPPHFDIHIVMAARAPETGAAEPPGLH